ncbi:hypothetical protein VE04_07802 [Pseudogymnoascus sp. 24MN13]|nr:hypothetical protein VE04_07802 [Pseudogymnoascus sp. 24MN13]
MDFSALTDIIISTLSTLVAAQEVPAIRICKNANYEDCLDIKATRGYCEDLYGPWNDSISSIKILSPALGICGFHKSVRPPPAARPINLL